jgi:hypothetical protein
MKLWSSLGKVTFEMALGVRPNNTPGMAHFLFSQQHTALGYASKNNERDT